MFCSLQIEISSPHITTDNKWIDSPAVTSVSVGEGVVSSCKLKDQPHISIVTYFQYEQVYVFTVTSLASYYTRECEVRSHSLKWIDLNNCRISPSPGSLPFPPPTVTYHTGHDSLPQSAQTVTFSTAVTEQMTFLSTLFAEINKSRCQWYFVFAQSEGFLSFQLLCFHGHGHATEPFDCSFAWDYPLKVHCTIQEWVSLCQDFSTKT